MSYQQYDPDYLFDQYYFQPARTTYAATFVPQGDIYGTWPSEALCSSTLIPESNFYWRDVPNKPEANVFPWADAAACITSSNNTDSAFEVAPEETQVHICPTCHKQYCRKSTLKAHLKQHLGHRPFTCQVLLFYNNNFT